MRRAVACAGLVLLAACASPAAPRGDVVWDAEVLWQGEGTVERIKTGRPDAADPRSQIVGVDQAGTVVLIRYAPGAVESEVLMRHPSELTGLAVADVDPDVPGEEIYVGGAVKGNAFPHFLTDLAAQIIMINEKEVDAPFLQRKVVGLQIFLLLEPENAGLHYLLGDTCRELGLMFSEFSHSRRLFLAAMRALQRSLELSPDNPSTLNKLAQLDFWFADYPAALRRWRQLVVIIDDAATKASLTAQIARLEQGAVPDHPLVEDLETIGEAMELLGGNDAAAALALLERLEEEGSLVAELPMPEFFHLLAVCRERTGDIAGAFAAFDQALALDATYAPALQGKDLIVERNSI